jgi:hypothetical protein
MNEKDFEDLLRSMPLKKPTALPDSLPKHQAKGHSVPGTVLTIVRMRIPLWAAGAAVVLAVATSAYWHRERKTPAGGAVVSQHRDGVAALPAGPSGPEPGPKEGPGVKTAEEQQDKPTRASAAGAAQEGFWKLPERYQRMVLAALDSQRR